MGILATRWEAEFEGHRIVVNRNEIVRGFTIEWDGQEIARRTWSLVGLGELHGSAEADGKPVDVKVVIYWGGFSEMDGKCRITVGDTEVPVRHVY